MNLKGNVTSKQQLHGKLEIKHGVDGMSAYEVAVANGFEGTEEEWLESLKGDMPDMSEYPKKEYVDKGFVAKYTPTYKNTNFLYAVQKQSDGSVREYAKEMSGSVKADVVPITGAGGTLNIGDPRINSHATTKKYVDDLVSQHDIITSASGEVVTTTDSAKVKPKNIKLFGKSKQDGIPSMETPIVPVHHGESGSINSCLYTNQLIDISALKNPSNWIKGTYYYQELKLPMGTYTISFTENNMSKNNQVAIDNQVALYIGTEKGTYTGNKLVGSFASSSTITNYTFTINEGEEWYINLYADGNAPSEDILSIVFDELIPNIMINVGNVALPCEHFTEQPFTFQTPNGLRGIPLGQTIPDAIKNSPIHMNGVYWDVAEEQYYISDYIDYNNKKRVETILDITLDGGEIGNTGWGVYGKNDYHGFSRQCLPFTADRRSGYCNQASVRSKINGLVSDNGMWLGVNNTGVYLIYNSFFDANLEDCGLSNFITHLNENPLVITTWNDEPVVTPLTQEEIDQYNAIVMNCPNTTIVNDAGAYMEVEYVADTKCYIDNKFKEMASAIAQLL